MKANPEITIKKEFQQTVIAFGNNGLPLNNRPVLDIINLGIIARESNDKSILKLFDQLPTLAELKAMKMQEVEKTITKSGIESKNDK